MNLFKRILSRFTVRGKKLALVEQGMVLARKNDTGKAIKLYSDVINSPDSPRDVLAMAMFNRALAYTAIEKQGQAKQDLKAIIAMPEAMTKIKRSANDKLVRMERKIARENLPAADGTGSNATGSGGDR